jgi:GNAT superfamily N-acetyltransferase
MTDSPPAYHIRKLWPFDGSAFRRHLLRLDPQSRHDRFGMAVGDAFLETYAETARRLGTVIYGAFLGAEMHASAELRSLHPLGDAMAEAAFAVEREHQHHGLGSALMDRIITTAQNRGIGELHMICMRDNGRMQRLAAKFGARMKVEDGDLVGHLDSPRPTAASLISESIDDTAGFVTAVLDCVARPFIAGPRVPVPH